MAYIAIFLGWLGLISGNLIWIGHGIYELVTSDKGFFTVLLSNGGYWLIHMIVSAVILAIGFYKASPKV